MSRRHLLRTLAGLGAAGAATAAGIAAADPAAAANGDNLILGQDNAATETTRIETIKPAFPGPITSSLGIGQSLFGLVVTNTSDAAIIGLGEGYAGVIGEMTNPRGSGLLGRASIAGPVGVSGETVTGPALLGTSTDGVTLELSPADRTGPPVVVPAGTRYNQYRQGAISVDDVGDLWLCVATGAPGTPGTWTRLLREDTTSGRVVPITPMRVLDTRTATGQAAGGPAVPGQVHGPLTGGQAITLDLAGITPIPTTATGVLGNATVVAATGSGYLRLFPAGATIVPSSLNFTKGVTVANAFTSAINPTGLTATAPITPTTTYHLILDITAYIT